MREEFGLGLDFKGNEFAIDERIFNLMIASSIISACALLLQVQDG